MIDRYLGEFAIVLGLVFLVSGFYQLARAGKRKPGGFGASQDTKPSWGFMGLGLLLTVVGATLMVLL